MAIQSPVAGTARLKVVGPGEGRTGGLVPGVGVVFKIDGQDSGGALSIVEHPHLLTTQIAFTLTGPNGHLNGVLNVGPAAGKITEFLTK